MTHTPVAVPLNFIVAKSLNSSSRWGMISVVVVAIVRLLAPSERDMGSTSTVAPQRPIMRSWKEEKILRTLIYCSHRYPIVMAKLTESQVKYLFFLRHSKELKYRN